MWIVTCHVVQHLLGVLTVAHGAGKLGDPDGQVEFNVRIVDEPAAARYEMVSVAAASTCAFDQGVLMLGLSRHLNL